MSVVQTDVQQVFLLPEKRVAMADGSGHERREPVHCVSSMVGVDKRRTMKVHLGG